MTREEADKIYQDWHDRVYGPENDDTIDLLIALGVLKLDAPSAEAKLYAELKWPAFGTKHTELHNALCRAGLKIVEK